MVTVKAHRRGACNIQGGPSLSRTLEPPTKVASLLGRPPPSRPIPAARGIFLIIRRRQSAPRRPPLNKILPSPPPSRRPAARPAMLRPRSFVPDRRARGGKYATYLPPLARQSGAVNMQQEKLVKRPAGHCGVNRHGAAEPAGKTATPARRPRRGAAAAPARPRGGAGQRRGPWRRRRRGRRGRRGRRRSPCRRLAAARERVSHCLTHSLSLSRGTLSREEMILRRRGRRKAKRRIK